MNLERVVRPFQDGDVFNARPAVTAPPNVATLPVVVVTWGNPIDLKYKAVGTRYQVLSVSDKKTEVVRVENPDDPSQFVDIERILKLTMKDDVNSEHHFDFGALFSGN